MLFMLDSSTGLEWREIRNVLKVIEKITTKLHKVPSKIALGLLQYSDMFTTRLELKVKRRPLGHTLRGIRNIRYRKGTKNYLGNSLKYVNRKVSAACQVY